MFILGKVRLMLGLSRRVRKGVSIELLPLKKGLEMGKKGLGGGWVIEKQNTGLSHKNISLTEYGINLIT